MEVLRLLVMNDGLCQRDVADAMQLSRARVTSTLRATEKSEVIRRVRDKKDREELTCRLDDLTLRLQRRLQASGAADGAD
jgi:DNA-binding MarR family transcriptional regulator